MNQETEKLEKGGEVCRENAEKETETDREQKDRDSLCFRVGLICLLWSQPNGLIHNSDCVCVFGATMQAVTVR